MENRAPLGRNRGENCALEIEEEVKVASHGNSCALKAGEDESIELTLLERECEGLSKQ